MQQLVRVSVLSLLVLVAACGARRPEVVSMPDNVRAQWDRCAAHVDQWCIDHSHGSVSHERACMQEESSRFAALADDAARAGYMASHGCRP